MSWTTLGSVPLLCWLSQMGQSFCSNFFFPSAISLTCLNQSFELGQIPINNQQKLITSANKSTLDADENKKRRVLVIFMQILSETRLVSCRV